MYFLPKWLFRSKRGLEDPDLGKREKEENLPTALLQEQVARVLAAIRAQPEKKGRILSAYVSSFFEAVKETIRRQGRIMSFYMMMADPVDFGVPPVTEEVTSEAKRVKAEALLWVEGFQSERDISDVIYHVALSSPALGVIGWVLKVKLGDGRVEFTREMPYHFDSPEKTKSLGELLAEIEKEQEQ
ncbi:MAG: hypothetical protein C4576_04740 [Desulfobacteraceae bacterium]|nr:MAG: hypothetical protein C4576_04740 [Desulfobacteraceae bacterium]